MHARRGVERSQVGRFELEKERERKDEVNYMMAFCMETRVVGLRFIHIWDWDMGV